MKVSKLFLSEVARGKREQFAKLIESCMNCVLNVEWGIKHCRNTRPLADLRRWLTEATAIRAFWQPFFVGGIPHHDDDVSTNTPSLLFQLRSLFAAGPEQRWFDHESVKGQKFFLRLEGDCQKLDKALTSLMSQKSKKSSKSPKAKKG